MILTMDYSEGVHAKEHYLICGVQGDFTRKLVEDPPKYIWTRELKVFIHPTGYRAMLIRAIDFWIIVRRRQPHITDIQTRYPSLHRYWSRCCLVNMSTGKPPLLVLFLLLINDFTYRALIGEP
jgi:hypothetical protein